MVVILDIQEKFFDERGGGGGGLDIVNTAELGKLVGSFCHVSQAWSLGKTLLWPLYMVLKNYREVTPEGKVGYRQAQVNLGYDAASAFMEWYNRVQICAGS